MPAELESSFNELLQYDLRHFASKMQLAEVPPSLPTDIAVRLLNTAEHLSRSHSDEDRNRCLLICGLLWEHRQEEWRAAPPFMMNLLSRIGLAPSMQMVNTGERQGYRYSPTGSILTEMAIEARNLESEILVDGRVPVTLSAFQHQVWQAMRSTQRLGISAPTSAGKSFVLALGALDLLASQGGQVVYIVPTISLIQQVTRDFRSLARSFAIADLEIRQSYDDSVEGRDRVVFVLTQERALAALGRPSAMNNVGLAIIDEIQNVERAADEDEERAHTLFDVLQELVVQRNPARAVISGPRVENIAQLTKSLFGEDAEAITAGLPPVVNLTYAFSRNKKETFIRQYVPGCTVQELTVPLSSSVRVGLFERKRYNADVIGLIAEITLKGMHDEGTLIFSPTSAQATRTAVELSQRGEWRRNRERSETLTEYVVETVHPQYALTTCLSAGVAFHHGKMPQHIRIAVEDAFSELDVSVLACTTTLMQGVNLPAKNIIARNPALFVQEKEGAARLTSYEFANLRGRAGRLLKDFVGRAVILDEGAFLEEELDFGFPEKTVNAGYQDRFERHRQEIVDALETGEQPTVELKSSDLVVYIRQAVFRFGRAALIRLGKVGIRITDEEFAAAERILNELQVSREVCARAPYWDPVALDVLHRANTQGRLADVPTNPFTTGFQRTLQATLAALRQVVPYYYARYLGEDDDRIVHSIASLSQGWAAERPLRELISWKSDDSISWEEIDRRLSRVNQQVAYQVPKLLRPLIAMQNPDNPILGMLEMGAYRPETRRLIELGLPRETAIRLRPTLGTNQSLAIPDDAALLRAASNAVRALSHWEQVQVDSLATGPS